MCARVHLTVPPPLGVTGCRAWLDLGTDEAVGMEAHAQHEEVAGDVIMGVLQRC